MAENANFSTAENECLLNVVVFGESEFLEISDSLDDDNMLIEENRNVHRIKKTKTGLIVLKRSTLAE